MSSLHAEPKCRLLPANTAQVRPVEEIDDAGLPGEDHLPVGQQRRRHRHVKVAGELFAAQVVGAKNCRSLRDGDSSSIESLSS